MIQVGSRMIRAGQLRSGMARDELENGVKFDDFADFGWIARWRWWGKVRSTCNTTNSRIKTNKTYQNSQITRKKVWGYFCGDFRIRIKNNKIKLENKEGRLRNHDQRGS